jgi:hypothetical protein
MSLAAPSSRFGLAGEGGKDRARAIGIVHIPEKACPDAIRDGRRFSEKDTRQTQNLEQVPDSLKSGRALEVPAVE